MKEVNFIFDGIQNALPQSNAKNGACREIINMRFRKGCWRPIPSKKLYKSIDVSAYTKMFVHDIEQGYVSGSPNLIALKYNSETGLVQIYSENADTEMVQIGADLNSTFKPNIVFLKRTLILTTSEGLFSFIWNGEGALGSYVQIANLPVPDVDLGITNSILVNEDVASGVKDEFKAGESEAIVGLYYQAINEQSNNEGRLYGSLMYMCAYRLFDGSYILPSVPRYFQISNGGTLYRENQGNDGVNSSVWWWKMNMAQINASINNDLYNAETIGLTKDLIDSVCVFATKVEPLHKIDTETLTFDKLKTWYTANVGEKDFKDIFPVNDEFKKFAESDGWYKIHEFRFDEVVEASGYTTDLVDTKGYYQNYATNKTLSTDQFTHHKLAAKFPYVYNDRLHLLNVKTMLGNGYIQWANSSSTSGIMANFGVADTVSGTMSVSVKTSVGTSVKNSSIEIPIYADVESHIQEGFATYQQAEIYKNALSGVIGFAVIVKNTSDNTYYVWWKTLVAGTEYYILPELIGYNDARAFEVKLTIFNGTSDVVLFQGKLKKNESMNFAYYHSEDFSPNELSETANYKPIKRTIASATTVTSIPIANDLPFDTNRLQVSEIQNPLIFPAKNSYQIGTGEGLAMAAGSEPLSTGQFGQFPLQIFTTKGIWAMEIGTGDVLYTNILPVNTEVINNADNVVPVAMGVCYTTDNGLYIINGTKSTQLSEIVENDGELQVITLIPEINELVTNLKYVPTLSNALSDVDFLTYLKESTIGYDYVNKELFVTNKLHQYSYIYSIESQLWYKISKSYLTLINAYPKLLGVTYGSIVSISEENNDGFTDCLIITQPQSFDAKDVFKKIERMILRCSITTDLGKYAGFYVLASNDLNKWQLITGKQRSGIRLKDLLIQRSHGSSKYFMLIFTGNINSKSEVKQIDMLIVNKLANKLR